MVFAKSFESENSILHTGILLRKCKRASFNQNQQQTCQARSSTKTYTQARRRNVLPSNVSRSSRADQYNIYREPIFKHLRLLMLAVQESAVRLMLPYSFINLTQGCRVVGQYRRCRCRSCLVKLLLAARYKVALVLLYEVLVSSSTRVELKSDRQPHIVVGSRSINVNIHTHCWWHDLVQFTVSNSATDEGSCCLPR